MTPTARSAQRLLSQGFPVERPELLLAWGSTEAAIRRTLKDTEVRRVVAGQLRLPCVVLGGLKAEVELHFNPRLRGRLTQIELLRSTARRRRKAFEDLQARLVGLLGPGSAQEPTIASRLEDVQPWVWDLGFICVTHDYYYQGALYEKVLFSSRQ